MSGKIEWPTLLQSEPYAPQRTELDELVAKWATLGGLGYPDQEKAHDAIDTMMATMKGQIREVPVGDVRGVAELPQQSPLRHLQEPTRLNYRKEIMNTAKRVVVLTCGWLVLAVATVRAAEPATAELIGALKSADEAARLKAVDQLGSQGAEAAAAVAPWSNC